MTKPPPDIEAHLRELEESHLRHDVRASAAALRAILAEDFLEFGSSGRVFNRESVIGAISTQTPFQSRIHAFTARLLAPDVALTTYRLSAWMESEGGTRVSLRSSIWARRDGVWVMIFHQGTPAEREAPIRVVEYDPTWPRQFERERHLLELVLRQWMTGAIEHIGSTAIPGLPAKPVIDIMAPIRSLEASRDAITALSTLGYVYMPYRPDVMHWFCKPSPDFRTHHLHLVPFGSELWVERIQFRDHLREHPEVAAEYAELKRQLAREYVHDREAYTDGKEPFVRRVLEQCNGAA